MFFNKKRLKAKICILKKIFIEKLYSFTKNLFLNKSIRLI